LNLIILSFLYEVKCYMKGSKMSKEVKKCEEIICDECGGNGYTYDNPNDMAVMPVTKSGPSIRTWKCWKCNGKGSVVNEGGENE